MRYYCPGCWRSFWNEDFEFCPECGYPVKTYHDKDYTEKLFCALNHPSGEIKHRVVKILEQQAEKRAIPYLETLQRQSRDPSLIRAAREAVTKIRAAR